MKNELFEDFFDEINDDIIEDEKIEDNVSIDEPDMSIIIPFRFPIRHNIIDEMTGEFEYMKTDDIVNIVMSNYKKINFLAKHLNMIKQYRIVASLSKEIQYTGVVDNIHTFKQFDESELKNEILKVYEPQKEIIKTCMINVKIEFIKKDNISYKEILKDLNLIRNSMMPYIIEFSKEVVIYFTKDNYTKKNNLRIEKSNFFKADVVDSIYKFVTDKDEYRNNAEVESYNKTAKRAINYSLRHDIRVLNNIDVYDVCDDFKFSMTGFTTYPAETKMKKDFRTTYFLITAKPKDPNTYTTRDILNFIQNYVLKKFSFYDLDNMYDGQEAGCRVYFIINCTSDLKDNIDSNTECIYDNFKFSDYAVSFKENRFHYLNIEYHILFTDEEDNLLTTDSTIYLPKNPCYENTRNRYIRLKDRF